MLKRFEDYYEPTNQMIGQGAFAQVFIAKNKQTGEKVAVKISNSNSPISQKEKEILQKLCLQSHPSVVKILDIFDNVKQKLLIVLEYCSGGTLYDLMVKNPQFELDAIAEIILQITQGLQHLHSKNIVHRDIKPENVLIQFEEGKPIYKITDFGLSSVKDKGMTTTKVGTAYYVAPEIFDRRLDMEGYDKSVDIWALGLMLDELIHGSPFYNGNTEDEVFSKIKYEAYQIRDDTIRCATVFEGKKYIIKSILNNVIVRDPSKRKDLNWIRNQLQEYKETQNSPVTQNDKVYEQKFQFLPQQYPPQNMTISYSKIQQPIPQQPSTSSQQINLLDSEDYYPTTSVKSIDQSKEKCITHGLPMILKVPGLADKSDQIVSICIKCLQQYGIFETLDLQGHILQAINELSTKGFDYFYKPGQLMNQIQMIFQNLYDAAFIIKIKDSFYEKYQPILQKHYEIAQKEYYEMQNQLKQLQQDQSYKIKWVNDALRHIGDDPGNKIVAEVHRKMKERRDKATQEVKEFFKEHIRLLAQNIKLKLDLLQ